MPVQLFTEAERVRRNRFPREIGQAVLNPAICDTELRTAIYRHTPPERLPAAIEECEELIRPLDQSYVDFLESRYGYIRQFAPAFLKAFTFRSPFVHDPFVEAVDLLRRLNADHRRTVPEEAPLEFVPATWRSSVITREGRIDRHYL
jgi:hypothetical protein